MRRKEDIQCLIEALSSTPNKENDARRTVLEMNLTESQVFNEWVKNIGMEERDENVYYAARDAARYLNGQLEATDIVPDIVLPSAEYDIDEDVISISVKDFNALVERVAKLEKIMETFSHNESRVKKPNKDDLISIGEATRLYNVNYKTFLRWIQNGWLSAVDKGKYHFVSVHEIESNPKLMHYINERR